MDLSGIIFVVLAAVWAVYLIPKALRQHDEVARSRSVDRSASDARVVARREPVSSRDARLVVTPAAAAPVQRQAPVPEARPPAVAPRRVEGRRTAGRVAARRRRRMLLLLLLLVVATAAAARLGQVPWWSALVPAGVTVGFLLLCHFQVRRHRARPHRPRATRPDAVLPKVEAEVAAPPAVADESREPERTASDDSSEQQVESDPEPVEAAPAPAADGPAGLERGALWDPLPVTLPTYVTKPKATRTVRTIDLGEAGTWTSGHTREDAEIAAAATEPPAADGSSTKAGQRAVGT